MRRLRLLFLWIAPLIFLFRHDKAWALRGAIVCPSQESGHFDVAKHKSLIFGSLNLSARVYLRVEL
jgi:hypothetical protein